jgi:hypothetical protein
LDQLFEKQILWQDVVRYFTTWNLAVVRRVFLAAVALLLTGRWSLAQQRPTGEQSVREVLDIQGLVSRALRVAYTVEKEAEQLLRQAVQQSFDRLEVPGTSVRELSLESSEASLSLVRQSSALSENTAPLSILLSRSMDPTTTLEATKIAFGLAKDLSVQLLTLASALIGLTVIFSKYIKKSHKIFEMLLVVFVLLAYLVSILSGIYTIMKLTGSLAPVGGAIRFTIDAARPAAICQIVSFLIATILFTVYGIIAIVTLWKNRDEVAAS